MDLEFAKNVGTAILLGFMIGLQREMQSYYEKAEAFAGVRTFAIISLIGYLGAYLAKFSPLILPVLVVLFGLLIVPPYVAKYLQTKDIGTTTEFAAIATLFVGMLIHFGDFKTAAFTAILLLFLLELKERMGRIRKEVEPKDVDAGVMFFVMTFVILPILPDHPVDPFDIVNPHQIWLMVVLIAGLSYIGYLAIKAIGPSKGYILTGFLGGLVSSTAVTLAFSKKVRVRIEMARFFAAVIAIASSTMYIRVAIEVAAVNRALLYVLLTPFLLATLAGYLYIYFLYNHSQKNESIEPIEFSNPLELKEALKIGILFGVIFGAIKVAGGSIGDWGVYITAIVSGLTDVDAITLSLAQLSSEGSLSTQTAMWGIVIATISNSLVKLGLVFALGTNKTGFYLLTFYLLTLAIIVLGVML